MSDFFTSLLTSAHNARVRAVLELRDKAAARRRDAAYMVEGQKLVAEAVAEGVPLHEIFVAPRLARDQDGRSLLASLRESRAPLTPVSDRLLERMSEAHTPQGILAIAVRPEDSESLPRPQPGRPLLVGWHVQDPGNLGALLRLAEATGAGGLLAAGGGADPYHPRTVRAAAGSLFRLRPATCGDAAALIGRLRGAGYSLLAAVPRGGDTPSQVAWSRPWALLLGGEGAGLPEELLAAADGKVAVPTEGRVESLSVPAAAAILLYEAQRRRLTREADPRPPRGGTRRRQVRRRGPGAG
jgi:TrmH family RNA methyltransferase